MRHRFALLIDVEEYEGIDQETFLETIPKVLADLAVTLQDKVRIPPDGQCNHQLGHSIRWSTNTGETRQ